MSRSGRLKPVLGCIGAITALLLVALACFAWQWHIDLKPKVSLKKYEEIVSSRASSSSSRYAFLPREIGQDRETTAFYHHPGFLMASDIICLRQRLPEEKIDKLLENLEQSGRDEVRMERVLGRNSIGGFPLPVCYPNYGRFEELSELPQGFRIFLHESDLEDINKNSNHNFLAFTAISPAKREVVYYASVW